MYAVTLKVVKVLCAHVRVRVYMCMCVCAWLHDGMMWKSFSSQIQFGMLKRLWSNEAVGIKRDAQCIGQLPGFHGMCENGICDKHTDGHSADMRMDPSSKMTCY